MKSLTAVSVAAFFSSAAAAYVWSRGQNPSQAAHRPTVVVADSLDLGRHEAGSVVQVRLPVRNAGTADLEVRDIRSACDCRGVFLRPPQGERTPGS